MRAFALSLLLILCAGCTSVMPDNSLRTDSMTVKAKPPVPAVATVAPVLTVAPVPTDPKSLMPALEARIAALIAVERARIDPAAKALTLDPELSGIARQRAADMAAKNYFAHTAPNGDTSATLLMAEDAHFQGLLGENMAAQHYTLSSGIDVEVFARRFVDTWLNSAPHKENLSFPAYNRTGVGAAVNGDTVYVTQLFSTDLGLGPHLDTAPPAIVTPLPNPQAGLTPPPKPVVPLRGSQGTP